MKRAYTFAVVKTIVVTVEADTEKAALRAATHEVVEGREYDGSFDKAEPVLKLIDAHEVTK